MSPSPPPAPITTLATDALLARLAQDQATILALIDQDEQIKRREHPAGILIANAGPTLFEPQWEHQLYAKGIVYARSPYRLLSLPLIKMYNHGLRPLNDELTRQVEATPQVRLRFAEKLDGTMIQAFAHQGKVHLTTRSVIEGDPYEQDFPYTREARRLLEQRWPHLLEAARVQGKTLVFELIHPVARQVTSYGGREDLVLLSIFDHEDYHYWSHERVVAWAKAQGLSWPQLLIEHEQLELGITQLRQTLAHDERIPEGAIVCFERHGRIIHRVKVKTQEYLERFAMRYRITLKSVVDMLWARPELHDWDAFLASLIEQQLSEEEVEAFYRGYFDQFMAWKAQIEDLHARAHACYDAWLSGYGAWPASPDEQRQALKALAQHAQALHDPALFPLVMQLARRGQLTTQQVMAYRPAYPGFREVLDA